MPLPNPLRVAVGVPLAPDLVERIAAEERLDVAYEPELYPPRVYASDLYGPPGWRATPEQEARFLAPFERAHILLGIPRNRPSLLARVVPGNPDLLWVHTTVAGGGGQVRAANLAPADLARVIYTTSAGCHAETLAEYAVFGVMCGAKELPAMQAAQRRHEWGAHRPLRHLGEMTVVVVGMGGIGRATAERFGQFGATVIGVNRTMREVPGVEMHRSGDLIEVVTRADAIINCLPGAVGTDNLIGADVLAAAKPGCIVVSLGRGSCLDEDALVAGLTSGHLAFAALDVTATEPLPGDSPLWDLPNVLITPHTAALSVHEAERVVDVFLDNVHRLLDGRPLRNLMDKELFY